MRNQNPFYQVTVPSKKTPLAGRVPTAAVEGLFMAYKNDAVPQNERVLVPANKRRGALLEREVKTEANWKAGFLSDVTFQSTLKSPLKENDTVSARFADEAEFEGSRHLNGIDEETAVNSPLAILAGKLNPWVDLATSGEIVGYLDRHITPVDAANPTRIVVRFV